MNRLWLGQIRGVMRLELKKTLLGRRGLPIYLLGALPAGIVALFVVVSSLLGLPDAMKAPGAATSFFANLFEFVLVVLYFGCVWTFMNLFRGEVLDRSLHYYFLAPIRREVLVAAKYLSGWMTSTLVFGCSTALSFLALHLYLGSAGGAGLSGTAMGHLFAYLGVTAIACLGYGAVFLVVGLYLRSLILPAFVIFLIEGANLFLPGFLQKVSVIFYLRGMLPVPSSDGAISVIAEPISAWLAVPGLLLFTSATLVAAAWRIRRMEIAYGAD